MVKLRKKIGQQQKRYKRQKKIEAKKKVNKIHECLRN